MSRERIFTLLHKMRACVVRQQNHECNGKCSECMYAMYSEEVVELLDNLIFMYGYVIKKKESKRHFWKKGAKK